MSEKDSLMESTRITIRISGEAYKKIEELLKTGEFKNMSDVIRTAIQEFLKARFSPPNISKIPVELPKAIMDSIDILVDSGDAVDKEDLIRQAVREYVNRKIKEIVREKVKEQQ